MSKTIDVDGGTPSAWPPQGDGPKRGKGKARRPDTEKPPAVVMAAATVFGLMVITVLLMGLSGRLGIANLAADEVGIKVNYITGGREVATQPGYKFYIPFVQEFFVLDKRTQDFKMQGHEYKSYDEVPELTVRADDGSNFTINDLRIQYELVPGDAGKILDDSGPGNAYKQEWIKSHARSVLRDEFGRFTAVEAANPTVYKDAPNIARQRLNQLLEDHGIQVTLIKTPNPSFDAAYEQAIESRKEANQEEERLVAHVEQLLQEKEQRLAQVRREKTVEMQELQGELSREFLASEAQAIQIRLSADEFATKKRNEGKGNKLELLAQARGLEAKYRKEAEGLESKAKALEERGEVVVREAIIEKLLNITFTLVPYSRDAAPQRLEHIDGRENSRLIDESITGEGQ